MGEIRMDSAESTQEQEINYKEGDWVAVSKNDVEDTTKISRFWLNRGVFYGDNGKRYLIRNIKRHATVKEISSEKHRRWWREYNDDLRGVKLREEMMMDKTAVVSIAQNGGEYYGSLEIKGINQEAIVEKVEHNVLKIGDLELKFDEMIDIISVK